MTNRYGFKVLVLGDGGVGKTTLINRYISGKFEFDTKMTIGVSFLHKAINYGDDIVDLQMWDFGGQEQFRFALPMYFQGALGIILMYSLVDPRSVAHINTWYELICEHTKDIPVLLAGSKLDIVEEGRTAFNPSEEEITKKERIKEHIKFSSKTGCNVSAVFKNMTKLMIDEINQ